MCLTWQQPGAASVLETPLAQLLRQPERRLRREQEHPVPRGQAQQCGSRCRTTPWSGAVELQGHDATDDFSTCGALRSHAPASPSISWPQGVCRAKGEREGRSCRKTQTSSCRSPGLSSSPGDMPCSMRQGHKTWQMAVGKRQRQQRPTSSGRGGVRRPGDEAEAVSVHPRVKGCSEKRS